MKFEHTQVFNFDGALRGMRNPLESWSKGDSGVQYGRPDSEWTVQQYQQDGVGFVIGPNDMNLAQRLIKGGSEHRKFLRQIFVSIDITAPLYWWKLLGIETQEKQINIKSVGKHLSAFSLKVGYRQEQ